MKKNKPLGYIAILIVVTIYGVSYISRDVIVKHMHATSVTFFQLLLMTVLFLAYNLITHKNFKVDKKDIPMIIVSGLIGTSVFHTLTILSVTHIGPTVSALMFGFASVFSLLIDVTVLKKRTNKLGVISVIISLTGVYILMGIRLDDLASTNFLGYALCIGSVIAWVVYCFLSDKISNKYDKTVLLSYQATAGMISTIPFLIAHPVSVSTFSNSEVLVNLAILGIINAAIAYFLNIYSIKQIGVTLANLFMNFMPIVTIVVAFMFYGTVPQMNQLIGGAIVIISVFMLSHAQALSDQAAMQTATETTES